METEINGLLIPPDDDFTNELIDFLYLEKPQSNEVLSDVSNYGLVMSTYRFPNGMVATFGYDNQQISELQGVYTIELHEKIKQHSDSRTSWNGFEPHCL